MAIGIRALMNQLTSIAAATGHFAMVQGHEPKSLPGGGPGPDLHFAMFLSGIAPAPRASGLAATTVRVEFTGRMYKPFMSQPEDDIDLLLAEACDAVFEAYSGDFDLGGAARNVDLLGAHGAAMTARVGYQSVDGNTYRVIDIAVPIIINDAFTQEA